MAWRSSSPEFSAKVEPVLSDRRPEASVARLAEKTGRRWPELLAAMRKEAAEAPCSQGARRVRILALPVAGEAAALDALAADSARFGALTRAFRASGLVEEEGSVILFPCLFPLPEAAALAPGRLRALAKAAGECADGGEEGKEDPWNALGRELTAAGTHWPGGKVKDPVPWCGPARLLALAVVSPAKPREDGADLGASAEEWDRLVGPIAARDGIFVGTPAEWDHALSEALSLDVVALLGGRRANEEAPPLENARMLDGVGGVLILSIQDGAERPPILIPQALCAGRIEAVAEALRGMAAEVSDEVVRHHSRRVRPPKV